MKLLDKLSSWQKLLLLLVLFLGLFIRFYRLSSVPPSLYYDEIDLGYQAKSLLQTGKDYRGHRAPFYVLSFNSDRTPLPAYVTAISTAIFNSPQLQVRAAHAFLGATVVFLAFYLVYLLTTSFWPSLAAAFVFATSPWQIQFSRWAYEGPTMLAVYLAGLISFFTWLKNKRLNFFYLAVFLLSLTLYTYRTMSLFAPLTILVLLIIYRQEIFKLPIKHLLAGGLLSAVIILPFLYFTTLGAVDQPRIAQLSIISDPKVPIQVMRGRELDSGDLVDPQLGSKPIWSSYFFHSKPVVWAENLASNYYQTFSADFLFLNGDPNLRHSPPDQGMLLALDFLGLGLGLWFLLTHINQKQYQWLLAWLLLSPLPSALTTNGGTHASRLFIFSVPLLIITALGYWQLVKLLSRFNFTRFILSGLAGLWLLLFAFYLHNYFVHYPVNSARSWGYGFKQAMLKIDGLQDQYQSVDMVASNDPPHLYYLYWTQVPPAQLQAYGTRFGKNVHQGMPLDKISVIDWERDLKGETLSEKLNADTLYLLTSNELSLDQDTQPAVPSSINLIDVIEYPDNTDAFYLIEKTSSDD